MSLDSWCDVCGGTDGVEDEPRIAYLRRAYPQGTARGSDWSTGHGSTNDSRMEKIKFSTRFELERSVDNDPGSFGERLILLDQKRRKKC